MNREFPLELKSVTDTGTFIGRTAVYGNTDLGGDRIKPGAFTKTLLENNGRVPLLVDHRIPIGIAHLQDAPDGLHVNATLNLEKGVARDVYSDLKFYAAHQLPYGMSFGYNTVQSKKEGEDRVLTEVRLFESSVTILPMNPEARVASVKAHVSDEMAAWLAASLAKFKRQLAQLDGAR